MKRTSAVRIVFPVDCFGEVIGFLASSRTFFRVLQLSKSLRLYISEEHPFCAENIEFSTTTLSVKHLEGARKYVIRLHLSSPREDRGTTNNYRRPKKINRIKMSNFPNLRFFQCYLSNEFFRFSKFEGISSERLLSVDLSGILLSSDDLKSLVKLKGMKLRCCEFDTNGFSFLQSIEELDISDCSSKISTKSVKDLTTLRKLGLGCAYGGFANEVDEKDFSKLENLEQLSISEIGIKSPVLEYLPRLRRFFVGCCFDFGDTGLKYVSDSLEELTIGQGHAMKDLSLLKNLKALRNFSCGFGQDNILSNKANKDVFSRITELFLNGYILFGQDEYFDESLSQFVSLKSLTVSTSKSISGECFASLKGLEYVELESVRGFTLKGYENLKKLENLQEVVICDCEDFKLLEALCNVKTVRLKADGSKEPFYRYCEELQKLKNVEVLELTVSVKRFNFEYNGYPKNLLALCDLENLEVLEGDIFGIGFVRNEDELVRKLQVEGKVVINRLELGQKSQGRCDKYWEFA